MQTQRLTVVLAALALAATLSLPGCGGGDSSPVASSSGSSLTNQPAGETVQTPAPAPAPSPAPAPAPTSAPTPPPTASTSNVTISWSAPTENTNGTALTDLAGFKIYYGTNASSLTNSIVISSTGLLTYVVDGLTVGTTYYFGVTAVASKGTESAMSSVVAHVIS
jgi:Fibronectin type III domain